MFIKLFFRGTDETFNKPLNEEVNGLINKWLGKENKYHGTFSRYCVSSMQGGSMSKDGILSFKDGGYVVVSSDDVQFISTLLKGIMMETNASSSYSEEERYELIEKLRQNGFTVVMQGKEMWEDRGKFFYITLIKK